MEFRSFEEFWPYYVGEHTRRSTRWLHFAGTTAAILCSIAAAILLSPWLLLAVPIAAYSLAWIGHFFVERNQPATFRHPLWSLWGDIRMYRLMWMGRMENEVRRVTQR
jgi:hypothetical protein